MILNDDTSLAVAPATLAKTEGNTGTTAYVFTVARAGATTGTSSVDRAVTGTGAAPVNAADFAATILLPVGTITFAPGQTSQEITMAIAADTAPELNESFTITLSNPTADVALTTPAAKGIILDGDIIRGTLGPDRLVGTAGPGLFLIGQGQDSITGGSDTGGIGVSLGTGTLTNDGSIFGGGGAGAAICVIVTAGGRVTNAGAIEGANGAATLQIATGYTNRLVVAPSALFGGMVDCGNGFASGYAVTPALASGHRQHRRPGHAVRQIQSTPYRLWRQLEPRHCHAGDVHRDDLRPGWRRYRQARPHRTLGGGSAQTCPSSSLLRRFGAVEQRTISGSS